ncbi:MAG: GTP-binding protein [Patescibacteria group bacterium]|nr:GTP-binding protein [Patescibacteria group bacterium]
MSEESPAKNLVPRPPVVTLLGHVDHGKTSLLSRIKDQDLTLKEFGGISQHTNAYQVTTEFEGEEKKITFIDTPGHAAFSKMRSRGGQIADLVILVVAADDGVQPQTKEAVQFAREAGVEIMVALNKIDLDHARPEEVKQELTELGLNPEDWGGTTTIIETSAISGKGVEELLEMILLWAETTGLVADIEAPFDGVIVESHLDPRCGPVATVLVREGMLKKSMVVYAGETEAKVKAMFLGKEGVEKAMPADPVEVLGFKDVPTVGSPVSEEKVQHEKGRRKMLIDLNKKDEKTLNLVLKADAVGTAQAVEASVENISMGDFKTQIVHCGVGSITENDIRLAADSDAYVLAFNTSFSLGAENLAEELGVPVAKFNIIYKLIERVNDLLEEKKREYEGQLPGMGQVIKVFTLPLSDDKIAGSRLLAGSMEVGDRVKITRDADEVHKARIKSIESKREEVEKAVKGQEVGLYLKPQFKNIKVGDVIEVI